MATARELLNSFTNGMGQVAKTNEEQLNSFMGLLGSCDKPGKLDGKAKELISVAIALVVRCPYCIAFHVYKALEAGATQEELREAAMVAVTFGAGPTMTYVATLFLECLEEFAPDFKA